MNSTLCWEETKHCMMGTQIHIFECTIRAFKKKCFGYFVDRNNKKRSRQKAYSFYNWPASTCKTMRSVSRSTPSGWYSFFKLAPKTHAKA